jgi:hypothetical protein
VKLFTVHAAPAPPPGPEGWPEPKPRPPVLLREGFCLGAALFGSFWFLWHLLWWEAAGLLALTLAAALLLPEPAASVIIAAAHLLAGLEARDRLRRRLARRGLPLAAVVAAPDLDVAWLRLAQQRPDLVTSLP